MDAFQIYGWRTMTFSLLNGSISMTPHTIDNANLAYVIFATFLLNFGGWQLSEMSDYEFFSLSVCF